MGYYADPNSGFTNDIIKQNINIKDYPSSVNWVEKGAVKPVVYQGKCASSWAFAVTDYLETIEQIYYGALNQYS